MDRLDRALELATYDKSSPLINPLIILDLTCEGTKCQ